jgi:Ca2+-binding EF-hand superfamily protein
MSQEEVDSMLREADDNSDGYLDYEGTYHFKIFVGVDKIIIQLNN